MNGTIIRKNNDITEKIRCNIIFVFKNNQILYFNVTPHIANHYIEDTIRIATYGLGDSYAYKLDTNCLGICIKLYEPILMDTLPAPPFFYKWAKTISVDSIKFCND